MKTVTNPARNAPMERAHSGPLIPDITTSVNSRSIFADGSPAMRVALGPPAQHPESADLQGLASDLAHGCLVFRQPP
jgi:hypothetical protein